jgi:hypothetical protein
MDGWMERVRGIEPPYRAWEARVLPLNYTRMIDILPGKGLFRMSCPVSCYPRNSWLFPGIPGIL